MAETFFPHDIQAPSDPIIGISTLAKEDRRPQKIDATIGILKTEQGRTYTPPAVEKAARMVEVTQNYLTPQPPENWMGDPTFLEESARLALGFDSDDLMVQGRLAMVGSAGGSGAVYTLLDTVSEYQPDTVVIYGTPTWPSHDHDTNRLKLPTITFSQTDGNEFNMDGQLDAIRRSPEDSVALFHAGGAHNPTGINPKNSYEWSEIAKKMKGRRAFFDAAYLGLSGTPEEDLEGISAMMDQGVPIAVAVSFSKNCGVYGERVGALIIPTTSRDNQKLTQALLNMSTRRSISNPPAFGEKVVGKTLGLLHQEWRLDLLEARGIIQKRRKLLAESLGNGFEYIHTTRGLFCMLPLTPEQVRQLREKEAVYILPNGRVNIGGLSMDQIPRLADAVRKVLYPKLTIFKQSSCQIQP